MVAGWLMLLHQVSKPHRLERESFWERNVWWEGKGEVWGLGSEGKEEGLVVFLERGLMGSNGCFKSENSPIGERQHEAKEAAEIATWNCMVGTCL